MNNFKEFSSEFVDFGGVRVIPHRLLFLNAFERKKPFRSKFIIQNISVEKKHLKIFQPNQKEFVIEDCDGTPVMIRPGMNVKYDVHYYAKHSDPVQASFALQVGYETTEIPIIVNIYEPVLVVPNEVDFGMCDFNLGAQPRSFSIYNSGNLPKTLQVVQEINSSVDVKIEPSEATILPETTEYFTVYLDIKKAGELCANLKVVVTDGSDYTVKVKVTCIVAEVSLEHPLKVNDVVFIVFPALYKCTSTIEYLLVRNCSASTVTLLIQAVIDNRLYSVSEARLLDSNFESFKYTGMSSLCPFQAQVISFSFDPQITHGDGTEKVFKATFSLTQIGLSESVNPDQEQSAQEKDYDSSKYTLHLFGQCLVPLISIIPHSLHFINVTPGSINKKVLQIKNECTSLPILIDVVPVAGFKFSPSKIWIQPFESVEIAVEFHVYSVYNPTKEIQLNMLYYKNPNHDKNDLVLIDSKTVNLEIKVVFDKTASSSPFFKINSRKTQISKKLKPSMNERKQSPKKYKPPVDETWTYTKEQKEMLDKHHLQYLEFTRNYAKNLPSSELKKVPDYRMSCLRHYQLLRDDVRPSPDNVYPYFLTNSTRSPFGKGCTFLKPEELICVHVKPNTLEFGQVPTDTLISKCLMLKNENPFEITFSVLLQDNRISTANTQIVVPASSTVEHCLSINLHLLGFFSTVISYKINPYQIFDIRVSANGVKRYLNITPNKLRFPNSNEITLYRSFEIIQLSNPLASPTSFSWKTSGGEPLNIFPKHGSVPAESNICCAVFKPKIKSKELPVSSTIVLELEDGSGTEIKVVNRNCRKSLVHFIASKFVLGRYSVGLSTSINSFIFNRGTEPAYFEIINVSPYFEKYVFVTPSSGVVRGRAFLPFTISILPEELGTHHIVFDMHINNVKLDSIPPHHRLEVVFLSILPRIECIPSVVYIANGVMGSFVTQSLSFSNKGLVPAEIHFGSDLSSHCLKMSKSSRHNLKGLEGEERVVLEPSSTVKLYLHFEPMRYMVNQLVLPVTINGLVGPADLSRKSLEVSTYLKETTKIRDSVPIVITLQKYILVLDKDIKTQKSTCPIKEYCHCAIEPPSLAKKKSVLDLDTPKQLFRTLLDFCVKTVLISVSDYFLQFFVCHPEYKDKKVFTVKNIGEKTVSFLVDTTKFLDSGFSITKTVINDVATDHPNKLPFIDSISELKVGEEVAIMVTFKPSKPEIVNIEMPIRLRDGSLFNYVYLMGTFEGPALYCHSTRIYFLPKSIGKSVTASIKIYASQIFEDSELTYTISECTSDIPRDMISVRFPEGNKVNSCPCSHTVIPVEFTFVNKSKFASFHAKVVFSEANASLVFDLFANSENDICTTHVSQPVLYHRVPAGKSESLLSASDMYPEFPIGVKNEYGEHMQRSLLALEKWLYEQGFQCHHYLELGIDVKFSEGFISSLADSHNYDVHDQVRSLSDLVTAFCEDAALSGLLHTPPEKSVRINYTVMNYKQLILFLKKRGACLSHVMPFYLLSYDDYLQFYKEFSIHGSTSVDKMQESLVVLYPKSQFRRLSIQCWFDVLLQFYKTIVIGSTVLLNVPTHSATSK